MSARDIGLPHFRVQGSLKCLESSFFCFLNGHIICLSLPWEEGGGEVLPEKLGGGVRPASPNPHPVYYQNLVFCQI